MPVIRPQICSRKRPPKYPSNPPHVARQIHLRAILLLLAGVALSAVSLLAETTQTPSIYSPVATPGTQIRDLSYFILAITGGIFLTVVTLLIFAIVKFHARHQDDESEPPQVYGSNQIELAWTVIPVLIVVVIFLTTARVLFAIQDASKPPAAVQVDVVGHQFWWEFRYPKLGVVTANELHIPVSDPKSPTPTFFNLTSADVFHSFWIPQFGGKTDLVPGHPNSTWFDPHIAGFYVGQCAHFCGVQHAHMLLRVYVQPQAEFDQWVRNQQQKAVEDPAVDEGKRVFQTQSCINCHTVSGTVATGRFGPDLTHFMSRQTIASGTVPNTPENLRLWIKEPDAIKPGALMPAMNLTDQQIDQVATYLSTLR